MFFSSIYALVDPITDQIRYIGQTRYSLEKRLLGHFKDRQQLKHKNNYNANWIDKLYRNYKLKPIIKPIELFHVCTQEHLNEREIYWINYYRSIGCKLNNTSMDGYYYIFNRKKDIDGKKLFCYNKNYELTIYKSGREAERQLGIGYKNISMQANGKSRNLGYVFSFIELTNDEIDIKFKMTNVFGKIKGTHYKTGEVVEFDNQMEAGKIIGCNFRNINQILNKKGQRKKAGGYYWEYINN